MKTIVGLYDNMDDAQSAVNALVQAGFDRADISLMARKYHASTTKPSAPCATARSDSSSRVSTCCRV